ncbi:hypothetical protein MGLY_03480 [Neomoorella glycerini]|uniref:MrpA C-terminal/MbhD domain-containing protein n=1 Tax=Neomoorella glycerini TaxID=55779 RepID=A0A6I5ZMB9_9FIRM|nr:hydrogenase subunit MbhD domain-containing protein [Moorella glycerini]QGP91024.1 hypothetical protein MGLY_03480 [Moorella glycerini]
MNGIEAYIFYGLLLFFLLACVLAVHQHDLLYAVLASGGASAILALVFYMLQAPDVAITEAAVGAGLSTVLYVLAISLTKREEEAEGLSKVVTKNE